MGSGDWFKTIISLKKAKNDNSKGLKVPSAPKESNGIKWKQRFGKDFFSNGASSGKRLLLEMPVDDMVATSIQTAIRAYMARRALRRLKGIERIKTITQGYSVKKQPSATLSYLHSWSRMQDVIKARRACMVLEDRANKKKLESQQKLEAKLNGLEVEWSGGTETMEEALGRIHQREDASVKRERAMAYAFSHQWRANSCQNQVLGVYELGKANWGWSWKERWIAARPWESRVAVKPISPAKKPKSLSMSKGGKSKNSPRPKVKAVKLQFNNGKGSDNDRRWSYPVAGKPVTQATGKTKI